MTAAVLEEDGSISIIPKEGTDIRRVPRRFRQFKNRAVRERGFGVLDRFAVLFVTG